MRITEISIRLGETVNLGDYSNFRPEIGATAVVGPFDDPDEAFAELTDALMDQLSQLVDDELERAGRTPKYTAELYEARYSEARKCIVVYRQDIALPVEKNWRDGDRWHQADTDLPRKMRYLTASKVAVAAAAKYGYEVLFIHTPDALATLPLLPDPGPEPLWSQKGLVDWFERIQVPQDEWDMLAALPHVTAEHIQLVYRNSPHSTWDRLKDAILAAPQQAVPIQGVEDALERYGFSDEDRDRFLEEEE